MISDSEQKKRMHRRIWTAMTVIALVTIAVAAGWLARPTGGVAAGAAPPEVAALESVQQGMVWIAQTVEPSVVFIEAEQKADAEASSPDDQDRGQGETPQMPEPFRRFFGPGGPSPPQPQPRSPQIGQGSGVIIDAAGYILTNNHVVGGASRVIVRLANGDSFPANVVGTDRLTDLAVIKIEPKTRLIAAKLGDADTVKPGMWAIAIGYPFGGSGQSGFGAGRGRFDEPQRYEPTLTVGVISATGRQIDSEIAGRPFRGLIQTDAPINPGNSGGPVVNIRAEVVGISQAIYTASPFGGNIGVGFAIPIDAQTKSIIKTLKSGATVVRGQLGVQVKPLTPALKKNYGATSGVYVDGIQPDSPAAKGGVKAEDVITRYNGADVASTDQFVTMVQGTKPGTVADLTVLRAGKTETLKVTVGSYSPDEPEKKAVPPEKMKLGLSLEALPEDQARDLGLSGGVKVGDVDPMSDGARAGLQKGDVIVKINRDEIKSIEDYQRAVRGLNKGDAVVIRAWSRRANGVTTFEIDNLSE